MLAGLGLGHGVQMVPLTLQALAVDIEQRVAAVEEIDPLDVRVAFERARGGASRLAGILERWRGNARGQELDGE